MNAFTVNDSMICNPRTRAWPARVAVVLCAALVTDVAIAATPTLQSIAVTPAAASISVGQKQAFTATGTFSDGSTQALGPAISNIAPGYDGHLCTADQRWRGVLGR